MSAPGGWQRYIEEVSLEVVVQEIPWHVHHEADECSYMLEGALTVEFDGLLVKGLIEARAQVSADGRLDSARLNTIAAQYRITCEQ
ncbi:hypothetical protein ACWDKQ_22510 [Saccharopolyspora sp. NPDC000995]